MPTVTVITPTSRTGNAIQIVEKALKKQTIKDFEWILQTKSPVRVGDTWSLNRDMNDAIRKSHGKLIVSWQDCTSAGPDTLEKFLFHYQKDPTSIVSGVGNKYSDENWIVETWHDPRIKGVSFHECPFNEIEFNLCAIPKKAFIDVGGYDEWLDKYYGMDGYSVVERLNILGKYKFYLDETIKSYSIEHDRPVDWDKKNAIGNVYNKRRKAYFEIPQLGYIE
jgi:hypothetical protein